MELTEEEKQRMREDGILVDDFLKVSEMLEELGFSENLKNQWDKLLIPLRSEDE